MQKERAAEYRVSAMAADALAISVLYAALAWARAWLGRLWHWDLFPGTALLQDVDPILHMPLLLLIVPLYLGSLRAQGTYDDPGRIRGDVLLVRIARAVGAAVLVLLGVLFALHAIDWVSRTLVAAFALVSIPVIAALRAVIGRTLKGRLRDAAATQVVVVGAQDDAAALVASLERHREWGIRVFGTLPPERAAELPALLTAHPVDQVFVAGRSWEADTLRRVAEACEEVGVRFSMEANFLGLATSQADISDLDGWSILTFSSTPADAEALAVKRLVDLAGAGLLLLLFSPLMALCALAIRVEDGGRPMFVQERCGLRGRRFRMFKFRSMRIDAEAQREELDAHNDVSGPVFKMERDPRVTRVGAFLRRTSIDELPQLWNVLRGEMSLVGPRPPLPSEVRRYERWQRRRLSMRPGMTCIWQVSGRSTLDFDTWMRLDLQYIDQWSLFLDARLLLRTIPAVVLGTGAR